MTATIAGNLSFNDDATVTKHTLSSTTPTKIGNISNKTERIFFRVDLQADGDAAVYIRLYPSAANNDKKGILLYRSAAGNDNMHIPYWEMPLLQKYLGEISAIALVGTPDIYVTEF